MARKRINIGIIGGGNMGGAIAKGICQTYDVAVCEQDPKRRAALKRQYQSGDSGRAPLITGDLGTVVERSQGIILAVKPQNFEEVLTELSPYVGKEHVVITIAAGITCRYVEQRLAGGARVVRAMPNLPVQIGRGITAVCAGACARKADWTLARALFNCIGKTVGVRERWMDAVTAASGSGPAYVFLFVEYFQKAVRSLGLSEALSKDLVMETLRGSLALLDDQTDDAATLRARVTSKGGTTQAAMDVFAKFSMETVFQKALAAARQRAGELSK